jgi:hypothetical protein
MKTLKIMATGVIMILTLCFATLIDARSKPTLQNTTTGGDGFAVLELFTSEGCSSCPPADELLAHIQKEYGNTPVYILAYHVDYWNRLGWKDSFSKPEFSKRQYQYSHQLNAQVYTPQLIVNGKAEFVGSDASAITSAVKNALGSKTSAVLTLEAEQKGNKVDFSYQINSNVPADRLILAIVQKQAMSKVTGGENSGRTLNHIQIVRDVYNIDITARHGHQQIIIPETFNAMDWEIIGLLQDEQTGAIQGATRIKL